MGGFCSAFAARFKRWRHPLECSIAKSHSVYNPLLTSSCESDDDDDDVWLSDEDVVHGSLVLNTSRASSKASSETSSETSSLLAQPELNYSSFLMHPSVIDQHLQGIADILGPSGNFDGDNHLETSDVRHPWVNRLDNNSGCAGATNRTKAFEEADAASSGGDATWYRSAIGP